MTEAGATLSDARELGSRGALPHSHPVWYDLAMPARIASYLLHGIDALPCEVEIDLDDTGMGERSIVVGLPDAAVKESIERVRSALTNSGYAWPPGRVLVNLAPADVRKEGPLYDLPIALGILGAMGQLKGPARRSGRVGVAPARLSPPSAPPTAESSAESSAGPSTPAGQHDDLGAALDEALDQAFEAALPEPVEPLDARGILIAGELALDGRVRPVRGVIAMASLAQSLGLRGVIVPRENAAEAAVVPGIESFGVSTLAEVVALLTGELAPEAFPSTDVSSLLLGDSAEIDFADVRGQESVKRAIIVAGAGGHNLIMLGPAGTGKSMMAKALPGVLPPMTPEEALEVTRVYSAAGKLAPGTPLVTRRPVRTPHHSASGAAIIGGGMIPRPGEVSLAHRGVLFLDELPEFPRDVLETLRQPMEDHVVTIARSHSAMRFPANFMLVAAMNPTPKGDVAPGEVGRRAMERYLAKLSGPLIDRVDIHVEAPAVPFQQLASAPRGTTSAQMREQILNARRVQVARQGPLTPNARLSGRQLDELAKMTEPARAILASAMGELGLSARAYDKIRRVSRTIADLAGQATIAPEHVAEAVQYRLLDRRL